VTPLVLRWITILVILILVYLIVKNEAQFKRTVDAATSGQVSAIVALQGRNPSGGY